MLGFVTYTALESTKYDQKCQINSLWQSWYVDMISQSKNKTQSNTQRHIVIKLGLVWTTGLKDLSYTSGEVEDPASQLKLLSDVSCQHIR